MKKIILFLCLTNASYAQTIKGIITDSIDKTPLEYCNIALLNTNKGVYSAADGNFEIDISNHLQDTLKVSSIGYISKFIPLSKYKNLGEISLNIQLTENTEALNEVLIITEKTKYVKKISLGEEKEGNVSRSSLIGYETCVFIKNPENEYGKLKRVYIKLKKREDAEFTATFNIKFYDFDFKNNIPGKELYDKNIIVKAKNKFYTLWIDVEDLGIMMPKEGICVGVEFMDPANETKKYTTIGPLYRNT